VQRDERYGGVVGEGVQMMLGVELTPNGGLIGNGLSGHR
jgi:hypothetical protein